MLHCCPPAIAANLFMWFSLCLVAHHHSCTRVAPPSTGKEGVAVSAFMDTPTDVDFAKGQVGFISFVVRAIATEAPFLCRACPLFVARLTPCPRVWQVFPIWNSFTDSFPALRPRLEQLDANKAYWPAAGSIIHDDGGGLGYL